MKVPNALELAWALRQRVWERELDSKGNIRELKELPRELLDNMISAVILAIEEERQGRHTDALFQLLEEEGLMDKAERKLERFVGDET